METITAWNYAWNCCGRVNESGLDLKRYVIVFISFSYLFDKAVHTYPLSIRFQILSLWRAFSDSVGENAGYVWTKPVTVKIFLRFQILPALFGRRLRWHCYVILPHQKAFRWSYVTQDFVVQNFKSRSVIVMFKSIIFPPHNSREAFHIVLFAGSCLPSILNQWYLHQ